MSGFQKQVNLVQAPGVAGDFASMNPFSSVLAGPAALVAPVGGLKVASFAWVNPTDLSVHQAYNAAYQIGFVGRNEQALITNFLGESTLLIPQGFMVNLFNGGDFFAYFPNGAVGGSTVYANETTGAPGTAATNTVTGSIGFTGTASLATVGGQAQMTLATITGASIVNVGDVVSGTGTASNVVQGLASGTANTVGAVYNLSGAVTTEAAEAVTTASNVLNVTAVLTGGLSVGDVISGTNVTAGTSIASVGTGVGGIGTYILAIPGSAPVNTASETITGSPSIATGFTVRGQTLVGAGVAKISASVS
jgi:hypothetical protein